MIKIMSFVRLIPQDSTMILSLVQDSEDLHLVTLDAVEHNVWMYEGAVKTRRDFRASSAQFRELRERVAFL